MIKKPVSLAVFIDRNVDGQKMAPAQSRPANDTLATIDERAQILTALNHLSFTCSLSFTKLTRCLGETTDIKRIIEIQKMVSVGRLAEIAAVLGLTLPELIACKKLPLYRVEELRRHVRQQDLQRGW